MKNFNSIYLSHVRTYIAEKITKETLIRGEKNVFAEFFYLVLLNDENFFFFS